MGSAVSTVVAAPAGFAQAVGVGAAGAGLSASAVGMDGAFSFGDQAVATQSQGVGFDTPAQFGAATTTAPDALLPLSTLLRLGGARPRKVQSGSFAIAIEFGTVAVSAITALRAPSRAQDRQARRRATYQRNVRNLVAARVIGF